MYLRKAQVFELEIVYSMGFDVCKGGQSYDEYLVNCRNSKNINLVRALLSVIATRVNVSLRSRMR